MNIKTIIFVLKVENTEDFYESHKQYATINCFIIGRNVQGTAHALWDLN